MKLSIILILSIFLVLSLFLINIGFISEKSTCEDINNVFICYDNYNPLSKFIGFEQSYKDSNGNIILDGNNNRISSHNFKLLWDYCYGDLKKEESNRCLVKNYIVNTRGLD